MNAFDNSISFSRLTALTKIMDCLNRIPIKVSAASRGGHGGSEQHHAKGNVSAFNRNFVTWRPLNNHRKDEQAPYSACKLWQSRMTPELTMAWERILRDEANDRVNIALRLQPKDVTNERPSTEMPGVPLEYELPKTLPAPESEQPMIASITKPNDTNRHQSFYQTSPTSETGHRPPPLATTLTFEEKLKQLAALQADIQKEASDEGPRRLAQLHTDLIDAEAMVTHIKQEIQTLATTLASLGIVEKPSVVKAHTPGRMSQIAEMRLYRDKATLHLKATGNLWTPTKELAKAIGFTRDPWRVFGRMIKEGKLAKQGPNQATEVRLTRV